MCPVPRLEPEFEPESRAKFEFHGLAQNDRFWAKILNSECERKKTCPVPRLEPKSRSRIERKNRPQNNLRVGGYTEPCKKQPLFLKLLPWRSSPEPCMPKYAFFNANFRGKSVTIHIFGTKRAKDASYRGLDASQRSRKRRCCRWAAGNVRACNGTSAVLFAAPYI